MVAKDSLQPSILEQILTELFRSLEESEQFHPHTLQALRELADAGQLSHAKAVEKAVKQQTGGES